MPDPLLTLQNVGPKVATRLHELGIHAPEDLRGQDPEDLFARTEVLTGVSEDPCLLDTYTAIVDHANGNPSRPWWDYSRERKAREAAAR